MDKLILIKWQGGIEMSLMTKEQYIESLRKLNPKVYLFGELIKNPVDHPIVRPSLNSVAMTYELAEKEEYKDVMTTISHLTGRRKIGFVTFIKVLKT